MDKRLAEVESRVILAKNLLDELNLTVYRQQQRLQRYECADRQPRQRGRFS